METWLIILIVLGSIASYGAIAGGVYNYLMSLYTHPDYPPRRYAGDAEATASAVAVLWLFVAIPYGMAAKATLRRIQNERRREESEAVLRNEGLI